MPSVHGRPSWAVLAGALKFWKEYFACAVPRTITIETGPPVLVFTDCAVEGEGGRSVTVGEVLVDVLTGEKRFLGAQLNDELVIGQAEDPTSDRQLASVG